MTSNETQTAEEIFRAALSACTPNELSLSLNIVGAMTAGVDPSTNPGLVNLWRSIGRAIRADIASRTVTELMSQEALDQLNEGVPEWFGDTDE